MMLLYTLMNRGSDYNSLKNPVRLTIIRARAGARVRARDLAALSCCFIKTFF